MPTDKVMTYASANLGYNPVIAVEGGGSSATAITNDGFFILNTEGNVSSQVFAMYNDGATATPVDGSGGVSTTTFSWDTTTPLKGVSDLLITTSTPGVAWGSQGQGVSFDFTIPRQLVSTLQKIEFAYDYNGASGDYAGFIYDVTNATLITPSLGASSMPTGTAKKFTITYKTSATSTSYRFIIHRVTTTNAVTNLRIGDIYQRTPDSSGGSIYSYTVGTNPVGAYKMVYASSTGVQHADYGVESSSMCIGVTTASASGGGSVTVQSSGLLTSFGTGLTPNVPIFLSSAGGYITDPSTIPVGSYRVLIGYTINTTDVVINISEPVRVISSTTTASIGLGRISQWTASTASLPGNFLPLDGRAISRAIFSGLFTLWGTSYGAGDGSTTFNIPDWTNLNVRNASGTIIGYWVAQVYPDIVIYKDATSVAVNSTLWNGGSNSVGASVGNTGTNYIPYANASGNVLLGTVTDSSSRLNVTAPTLGSTVNSRVKIVTLDSFQGNGAQLDISSFRHTAGSSWSSGAFRIQPVIDGGTWMGYIQFGGNSANNDIITFGTGGAGTPQSVAERMRITPGGNVLINNTYDVGANLNISSGIDKTTNNHKIALIIATKNDGGELGLFFRNSGSTNALSRWSGIESYETGGGVRPLVLNHNGGSVLVGLTSTMNAAPLQVKSLSPSVDLAIFANSNYSPGTSGSALVFNVGAATGDTSVSISATKTGGTVWNNLSLVPSGGNLLVGTTATNAGRVQIVATGSAVPDGDTTDALVAFAVNRAFGQSNANVSIIANDSPGITVGGTLGFGGNYGTTYANYALIKGYKENGTVGDFAGVLAFGTRQNGQQVMERMLIRSGGDVVIGGSASVTGLRYLDIYNTDGTASSGVNLRLITQLTGSTSTKAVEFYTRKNGQFSINNGETSASAFSSFEMNGVEALRINSSRNLLVGTTNNSPLFSSKVHIVQGAGSPLLGLTSYRSDAFGTEIFTYQAKGTEASPTATANGDQLFTIDAHGYGASAFGKTVKIVAYATEDFTNTAKGSRIEFVTTANGTVVLSTRLQIDQDGKVRINRTTDDTSGATLQVSGGISSSSLTGAGNRAVYSTATGALTNSASDIRLKTNVENSEYSLPEVMLLRPVTYNWKDTETRGTQKELGLIANEVKDIIPEVVGTNSDGTLSLDYSKLVAVLINAVQDQQKMIHELQVKLSSITN